MNIQQQADFLEIWQRHPEYNNRFSSVWWFFLLLPKQAKGYGPKQMMFALVSRAGNSVAINRKWHTGFSLDNQPQLAVSQFEGMALGWIHDGTTLHENLILEPGVIHLDQSGQISLWQTETKDNKPYGGAIDKFGDKPYGVVANFVGKEGYGKFEVWGDTQFKLTSPERLPDIRTKLGGTNVVAWRHLYFQGEFASPTGVEELEGIGYFQRVCFDVPMFPWQWIFSIFEDGSTFSFFTPYLNLNLLRRGDWFFNHLLESTRWQPMREAQFSWGKTHKGISLEDVTLIPYKKRHSKMPAFIVNCQSKRGDFLRFKIVPHSHAQYLVDRRIWGNWRRSRFNYNEFLFKVQNLEGQIAGKSLNHTTLGNGWGNIEYTWGMGL